MVLDLDVQKPDRYELICVKMKVKQFVAAKLMRNMLLREISFSKQFI